jgi:hypothetical protein
VSIPVRQTTDARPDAGLSEMVLSVLAAVAANPLLILRSGAGQVPQEAAFSATSEQVSLAPAA